MKNEDVVYKSARELAALVRTKQISPVELVRIYLDRIEALNPKLHAFISVYPDEAMAKARKAEQDLQAGRDMGPFHGVPYAPKDICATKGHRTTNNSDVTKNNVTDYESTVTDRLNKAGAIMVGKLSLSPFATGDAQSTSFPIARNPWHPDHSAAGSSSGSGSALAAYLTPLSLGTDTGGSIRGPASANGIVGMKQTYGRVSRHGVTTLSWSLDHCGPMTKTVGDNAAMLNVIAGHDPKDPTTTRDPVPDYTRALTGDIKGLRIGIPKNHFFDTTGFNKHDPESVAAVHAAIQKMVDLGATTVDVDIPHADLAGPGMTQIYLAEGACYHEQRLRDQWNDFDLQLQRQFGSAKFFSATDYIKAQRLRTLLQQEIAAAFEACDVLVMPATQARPAKLETTEANRAIRMKTEGRPGVTNPRRGNTAFTNMTGNPSLVIPCGFFTGTPTFPIAIMLNGKPFDEFTLYRLAHAYESATDWHQRRPPLV